jgi:hypothetical protein
LETGLQSYRLSGVTRVALCAGVAAAAAAVGGAQPVQLSVFADTGIRLTDVVWTGSRFLYVENTTNTVWVAGPSGAPLERFASMPNLVEETRCRLSPGTHGFPAGALFCHAPGNTIYRIAGDGTVSVFATLPEQATSDGALAFDTVGKLGYGLVAATGRSGSATAEGGAVYAISAAGAVRLVGSYPGPGGAEEVAVLPAHFGAHAGELALTVDAGEHGTIVVMDAQGRARVVASLPDGPNPIAVVAPARQRTGLVRPGLYVVDTASHDVFFAPATQLAPYVGDVIVGSEVKGLFWVVRPQGRRIQTLRLPTGLPAQTYNFEGATYVTG